MALALEIIEYRAYAAAKELIERPETKAEHLPNHPMIDEVWEIQAELIREIRAAHG